MELNKVKLSKKCRLMKVCGINIIGNPDTGEIIGLDYDGEKLLFELKKGLQLTTTHISDTQKKLLTALLNGGYIDGNEKTENRKQLNTAYLHVTSRCNLNCEGCYSYEQKRNEMIDLPILDIKNILDKLAAVNIKNLILSGGEPFLRDDITEILKYAKEELNIKSLYCITNGMFPAENYLNVSKYTDRIIFSLDGVDEESSTIRSGGVHKHVVDNIKILKSMKIMVALIFTLHSKNLKIYKQMGDFAKELGIPFNYSLLAVNRRHEHPSELRFTKNDYNYLHDIIKNESNPNIDDSSLKQGLCCKLSCGAGKTMLGIGSDGGVYPCHMFIYNDDFLIGSALNDDIHNILGSKVNKFSLLDVENIPFCEGCEVKYLCGSGCRYRSYMESEDLYGVDALCSSYKYHIEQTVKKLAGIHE